MSHLILPNDLLRHRSVGGASSFTLQESREDATPDSNILTDSTDHWLGTTVVPASSFTITRLDIFAFKTGAMGTTSVMAVYLNNAGALGAQVGADSPPIDTDAAFGGSHAWVPFPGMSCAVTNGVEYWFVLKNSAPVISFGTWWGFTATASRILGTGSAAPTWATQFPGNQCCFRAYKSP